jgi:hypothetical protein
MKKAAFEKKAFKGGKGEKKFLQEKVLLSFIKNSEEKLL